LGVVHFFIENRMSLVAFLMVILAAVVTLVGMGVEGVRLLASTIGLS
jgi:chromosome partitioning protein